MKRMAQTRLTCPQSRKSFIEWIMVLPEELDRKLYGQIKEYEEEHKMDYISIAERIGMELGMERGMERGIKKGETKGKIDGEITVWEAILQNPKIPDDLADQARKRLAELKSHLANT